MRSRKLRVLVVLTGVAAALALPAVASAQTGGASTPGAIDPVAPPPPTSPIPGKATLLPTGIALAPVGAPPAVVNAIAAVNTITTKPYIYGGGHKSFYSKGYDCSGTVSFALNGAGILKSPLPSGPFMKWGAPGPGTWITTYANKGHMYAVIAGLRLDTSAVGEPVNSGSGPRWRATPRSSKGYVARHYPSL